MAKERDLQLLGYDISENRYRELKYFCRQYKEKQKKLASITELSSPQFGTVRGGVFSDKTANVAIKKARLAEEMKMIEQSALEADGELYEYILENVIEGTPFEYLDVPTSRSGFYAINFMR
ncbi:hypothetical protein [Anaerotignum sp. MB30-C6]|uniref:hypothetical protein n=1 Tax=Anaerotignum sp. MB30-C6 TaxID=3070814 RepID=UPI0027DACDC5|nr:hypothetical protein [Anaerotignum sp. MB30-C6]WMI82193.1 hypothetical protein RBQ60_05510 [Anaerotignum sp. MB30-C6]